MSKENEQRVPSKLIQQFYDEERHLDHMHEEQFMKQITFKIDVLQAGELSAIAKVFNLPLSGLIAEILESELWPMILSLDRQELVHAGLFYEDYLRKLDFNVDQQLMREHKFQEALDSFDIRDKKVREKK